MLDANIVHRSKSPWSLLSIGGFHLGTVSETNLSDICQAINDLSGNQQAVVHMLEEQMTTLNVSRFQIAGNHQTLIELVECLNTFEFHLENLTKAIHTLTGPYLRQYKGRFTTWKPLFRESKLQTKHAVP